MSAGGSFQGKLSNLSKEHVAITDVAKGQLNALYYLF